MTGTPHAAHKVILLPGSKMPLSHGHAIGVASPVTAVHNTEGRPGETL